jgi:hypothetical protein
VGNKFKISKNKWQKINYHPTWQAFFREWGGTCRGTQVPLLFFPKNWHLLGGAGRVRGVPPSRYQVPAKSTDERSLNPNPRQCIFLPKKKYWYRYQAETNDNTIQYQYMSRICCTVASIIDLIQLLFFATCNRQLPQCNQDPLDQASLNIHVSFHVIRSGVVSISG